MLIDRLLRVSVYLLGQATAITWGLVISLATT